MSRPTDASSTDSPPATGDSRSETNLTTGHSIDLIGLACEATYHYRASSANAAGTAPPAPTTPSHRQLRLGRGDG